MSTYTVPAAPNLLATLWGPLEQIVTPLLDDAPAVTDPGIPELLAALGETLTAAVRVTRGAPAAPAPVPVRSTPAVRPPAARVTTAQVGSVAGEPKPGSLRARLITHLAEHPDQEFTATELFHALGATSGGAVGAALNTMTAHGEAILVGHSPKRYAAPSGVPAPAASSASPAAEGDQDTDEPDTGPAEQPAPDTQASEDGTDAIDETANESADTSAAETTPDQGPAPAQAARTSRNRKTKA